MADDKQQFVFQIKGEDLVSNVSKKITHTVNRHARQMAKAYQDSTTQIKSSIDRFRNSWSQVAQGLSSGISMLQTAGRIAGQVWDAVNRGAKRGDMRRALQRATGDAEGMLNKLREAVRGTVSDMELLSSANLMQSFGIDAAKGVELMDLAYKASIATGQDMEHMVQSLTTAVARQSPMILDNLGIQLKVSEAHEIYARKLGKSVGQLTEAEKKQAFLNAALIKGSEAFAHVEGMESHASALSRVKAGWENLKDSAAEYGAKVLVELGQGAEDWKKAAQKHNQTVIDSWMKLHEMMELATADYTRGALRSARATKIWNKHMENLGRTVESLKRHMEFLGLLDELKKRPDVAKAALAALPGGGLGGGALDASALALAGVGGAGEGGKRLHHAKRKKGRGGGGGYQAVPIGAFGPDEQGMREQRDLWRKHLKEMYAEKREFEAQQRQFDDEITLNHLEQRYDFEIEAQKNTTDAILDEFNRGQEAKAEAREAELADIKRKSDATKGFLSLVSQHGFMAGVHANKAAKSFDAMFKAAGPEQGKLAAEGALHMADGLVSAMAKWAPFQIAKELALGFSFMFLNPAESFAHFTAAAILGAQFGMKGSKAGKAGGLTRPSSNDAGYGTGGYGSSDYGTRASSPSKAEAAPPVIIVHYHGDVTAIDGSETGADAVGLKVRTLIGVSEQVHGAL